MQDTIIPEFFVEIHKDFTPPLIKQISSFLTKVIKDKETHTLNGINTGIRFNLNFVDEFGKTIMTSVLCLPLTYTFQQVSKQIKKLYPTKFLVSDPLFSYDNKLVSYNDTLASLNNNKNEKFYNIKVIDQSSNESFSAKQFHYKTFNEGEDTIHYKVINGQVHVKPLKKCSDVPFHKYRSLDNKGVDAKQAIFDYTCNAYRETNHRMAFDLFNDTKAKTLDEDFINKLIAMYNEIFYSQQNDLPNKTFRCMQLSNVELNWYKECVGEYIYLPTFTSTSRKVVESFIHPGATILVFLIKPGKRDHVMDLSTVSVFGNEEEEILLNPCTRCLVREVVEEGENPKIFLELEDGCCFDYLK